MTTTAKKATKKKALTKVTVPETDSQRMISVIEKAAMNPDVDPEKMRQLLDVQIAIMDRQAKIEYDEAMSLCQSEMAELRIVKNAMNNQTNSSYAKHEAICAAIKPIYTKHGFRLSFSEGKAENDSEIRECCVVTHKKGFSESFHIDLPLDLAGIKGTQNKTPIHAKTSSMTYGRRTLTLLVFDLPTFDDNDGNFPETKTLAEWEAEKEEKNKLPEYPADKWNDNFEKWKSAVELGKNPETIVSTISTKYTLTDEQKQEILNIKTTEVA